MRFNTLISSLVLLTCPSTSTSTPFLETPTPKAALILVPGAFHAASVYDPLVPFLTAANYTSIDAVSLPSVGWASAGVGRDADVAAVRVVLDRRLNEGREVVLVGNSYGASVIGEAVRGREGRAGVKGLVMIAGYIPTIAEALSSPPRQDIRLLSPPWFKFIPAAPTAPVLITWNGDLVASPPAETFYNLLPVAEAERWAAQLAPSSFEAINTTADYVPYDGKVRTLYVRCLHDNTVTEEIVDGYLGQPGARFEVSVLDADHVPMLSRPEMVVGVIREFAEGGVL